MVYLKKNAHYIYISYFQKYAFHKIDFCSSQKLIHCIK